MFDVHKVMQVMSEILSDRYDMKITMTAVPKDVLKGLKLLPQPKSAPDVAAFGAALKKEVRA